MGTVLEQAQKEIREEIKKEAVIRLKDVLRRLAAAKQVVANLEREVEDLNQELEDKLNDVGEGD